MVVWLYQACQQFFDKKYGWNDKELGFSEGNDRKTTLSSCTMSYKEVFFNTY